MPRDNQEAVSPEKIAFVISIIFVFLAQTVTGQTTAEPSDPTTQTSSQIDSSIHENYLGPYGLAVLGIIAQIVTYFAKHHCDKQHEIQAEMNSHRLAASLKRRLKIKPQNMAEWGTIKNIASEVTTRLKKLGHADLTPEEIAIPIAETINDTPNEQGFVKRKCLTAILGRRFNPDIALQINAIANLVNAVVQYKTHTPTDRSTHPSQFEIPQEKSLSQTNAIKDLRLWFRRKHSRVRYITSNRDRGGSGRSLVPTRFYNELAITLSQETLFWTNASTPGPIERFFLDIYETFCRSNNPPPDDSAPRETDCFSKKQMINLALQFLNHPEKIIFFQHAAYNTLEPYLTRLDTVRIVFAVKNSLPWIRAGVLTEKNEISLGSLQTHEADTWLKKDLRITKEQIENLSDLTEKNPFLVELVRGTLLGHDIPVSQYLEELQRERTRLGLTDNDSSFSAILNVSLNYLRDRKPKAYQILCFCAALASKNIPDPYVKKYLTELNDAGGQYYDFSVLTKDLTKLGLMAPHKKRKPMVRKCVLLNIRSRMYDSNCVLTNRHNATYLRQLLAYQNAENEIAYERELKKAPQQLEYCEEMLPFIIAHSDDLNPLHVANFYFFMGLWFGKNNFKIKTRYFYKKAKEKIDTIRTKFEHKAKKDKLRIYNANLWSDMNSGFLDPALENFHLLIDLLNRYFDNQLRKNLAQNNTKLLAQFYLMQAKIYFNASELFFFRNNNEESYNYLNLAIKTFDKVTSTGGEVFKFQLTTNFSSEIRRHIALLAMIRNDDDTPVILIEHTMRSKGLSRQFVINNTAHLKAVRDCLRMSENPSDFDPNQAISTVRRILKSSQGYPKALAVFGSFLANKGRTTVEKDEGVFYLNAILEDTPSLLSSVVCFSQKFSPLINPLICAFLGEPEAPLGKSSQESASGGHSKTPDIPNNNRALIEPWLVAVLHLANKPDSRLACYYHWSLRYSQVRVIPEDHSKEVDLSSSKILDTAFALLTLHAARAQEDDIARRALLCVSNPSIIRHLLTDTLSTLIVSSAQDVVTNRTKLTSYLSGLPDAKATSPLGLFQKDDAGHYREYTAPQLARQMSPRNSINVPVS